jgi:hypothetical protein
VAAAVYVKARRKGGVLGFILENRKRTKKVCVKGISFVIHARAENFLL